MPDAFIRVIGADGSVTEAVTDGSGFTAEIPEGEYTLIGEKDGYVPREYKLSTAEAATVELHIWGDVNGDNRLNVTDVSLAAAHVKSIRALTDEYDKKVTDVNGDGKLNVTDLSKIAAAVKGIKPIRSSNEG